MERNQVFETIESSPNFPEVPVRLREIISLLQDPTNVDIDELVIKIQMIEGIEGLIIRYINTEYFNLKEKLKA